MKSKTKPGGYDERVSIRVRGLEGLLSGCERKVRLGETICVGRSRECDLHPRNGEVDIDPTLAKKMSRKHLRISFCHREHVEVEDISANGTLLHGKRFDKVVLKNITDEPAVFDLRAGTLVVESSP